MIELLYDAVALPVGLLNQNGDTITVPKGTASKIVNREAGGNVRQDIRTHSTDQRVLDSIEDFFKTEIVPKMTIPVRIGNKERGYIDALMDVYAESTGEQDFKVQTLDAYPDVKQHFIRQRNDYFAAEAVRRGTRPACGNRCSDILSTTVATIRSSLRGTSCLTTWITALPD